MKQHLKIKFEIESERTLYISRKAGMMQNNQYIKINVCGLLMFIDFNKRCQTEWEVLNISKYIRFPIKNYT